METLTKQEIFQVIDRRIKKEIQLKNEYINKNGFNHIETLKRFDTAIATLTSLYCTFDRVFWEKEK